MMVKSSAIRPLTAWTARPQAASAPKPAPIKPGDLEGLSASAYGSLARAFREKGRTDLADHYTMEAVKAAKTPTEALEYAAQLYGPQADARHKRNQTERSNAPYVASPDVQIRAFALAAARFKTHDEVFWALMNNPAQPSEANTPAIKRLVDLAADSEELGETMWLIKELGAPEAIAYAEEARKTKEKPSFWTSLGRLIHKL